MEKSVTDTIVDKLLIQAIAGSKELIGRYRAEIKELDSQINVLNKELEEYLKTYQDACKHKEGFSHESEYTEGGYDHVSVTKRITKCNRCRMVLETSVERGTYA
jgi:phage host-nuclease inhibitor protein Gam